MAKKNSSVLPDSAKKYQPFRYPGGKSKLAINPAFRAMLYPIAASGDTFYEGFVGSAAVTLDIALHFPEKKLVVCDKDFTISGFWELIANGTDDEVAQLESLILNFPKIEGGPDPSLGDEGQYNAKVRYFRQLRATSPTTLVERAYHALFFNRTTFSGIAMSQPIGGYNQTSKWTIDCRYNAPLLVEKIRNLRKLLHGRLTVYNEDILVWLNRIPAGVPLYLDPPYYVKGEALYPVAMENFEHGNLARALAARTNWVMSYDICPEITGHYENQTLLQFPFRYSINGTKKNWNDQNEYLICSPEIPTVEFEAALIKWKQEVEQKATKAKVVGEEND